MKKNIFITIYLLFIALLLVPYDGFCVSIKDLFHRPPDARAFKQAGLPLKITAKLNGTRNVNHKIKLIAVIDGKALEVSSNQVYWDEYDRPVYDFEIFYPKRTLSYSFVMDEYANMTLSHRSISKRYNVNRLCDFAKTSNATDPLQLTLENADIEERKEFIVEETLKLLRWFDERVANDEEN